MREKGEKGKILKVLRNQPTATGYKVEIQLLHYDPNNAFKTITIDHDDIVEERCVSMYCINIMTNIKI